MPDTDPCVHIIVDAPISEAALQDMFYCLWYASDKRRPIEIRCPPALLYSLTEETLRLPWMYCFERTDSSQLQAPLRISRIINKITGDWVTISFLPEPGDAEFVSVISRLPNSDELHYDYMTFAR